MPKQGQYRATIPDSLSCASLSRAFKIACPSGTEPSRPSNLPSLRSESIWYSASWNGYRSRAVNGPPCFATSTDITKQTVSIWRYVPDRLRMKDENVLRHRLIVFNFCRVPRIQGSESQIVTSLDILKDSTHVRDRHQLFGDRFARRHEPVTQAVTPSQQIQQNLRRHRKVSEADLGHKARVDQTYHLSLRHVAVGIAEL